MALAELMWPEWAEIALSADDAASTATALIARIAGLPTPGPTPALTERLLIRTSPTRGFRSLHGLTSENWRIAERQLYRVSPFALELASKAALTQASNLISDAALCGIKLNSKHRQFPIEFEFSVLNANLMAPTRRRAYHSVVRSSFEWQKVSGFPRRSE